MNDVRKKLIKLVDENGLYEYGCFVPKNIVSKLLKNYRVIPKKDCIVNEKEIQGKKIVSIIWIPEKK